MVRLSKSSVFVGVALVAMAVAGAASAAPAEFTREQVVQGMAAQGYGQVRDIRRDGDLWVMTAVQPDGKQVDLKVDARSGQVHGSPNGARTTGAQVETLLAAAGYAKVESLAFLDDRQWHAVVSDKAGRQSNLKVDDATGRIIAD